MVRSRWHRRKLRCTTSLVRGQVPFSARCNRLLRPESGRTNFCGGKDYQIYRLPVQVVGIDWRRIWVVCSHIRSAEGIEQSAKNIDQANELRTASVGTRDRWSGPMPSR